MSYVGIVPGERSSGELVRRVAGIAKTGNAHVAQSACRSRVGYWRCATTLGTRAASLRPGSTWREVVTIAVKATTSSRAPLRRAQRSRQEAPGRRHGHRASLCGLSGRSESPSRSKAA
ncbi:MAG: hypothetical protein IPJ34_39110 [Myxococcales bacterium]|nr:hypothetical protein [Myxococcales bacterium]